MVAVAVAAPAFATSIPCVVQTNFDDLTPGTKPTMLTFLPSTITATIAYSSTGNGGDDTPGGTGQVAATDTDPSWNYLEVEMLDQLTLDDTVTVTITFTQAVTNLTFRIHDIDKTSEGWDDLVIVNTTGFTYSAGTDVIGNGTALTPFRNQHTGDQDIDSGRNHVDLTWAGPVAQVQFIYKAGQDRELRQPAHRHRQHQLQRLRRQSRWSRRAGVAGARLGRGVRAWRVGRAGRRAATTRGAQPIRAAP